MFIIDTVMQIILSGNTFAKFLQAESSCRAAPLLRSISLIPVQRIVPVEFIDWMENQHLTAKEMVEKLEMCLEYGYEAVMRGDLVQAAEHPISDPVTVESVDLSEYDGLCGKEVAVS